MPFLSHKLMNRETDRIVNQYSPRRSIHSCHKCGGVPEPIKREGDYWVRRCSQCSKELARVEITEVQDIKQEQERESQRVD